MFTCHLKLNNQRLAGKNKQAYIKKKISLARCGRSGLWSVHLANKQSAHHMEHLFLFKVVLRLLNCGSSMLIHSTM